MALRKHLNCFANIRPCFFPSQSLTDISPLKKELVEGVDFITVRELCGGIYFGDKQEADETGVATDMCTYNVEEIERVTRVAAYLARDYAISRGTTPKITSIDKANVLATSRLWKQVVTQVIEREFPDIHLEHLLVDAAAMHMVCCLIISL